VQAIFPDQLLARMIMKVIAPCVVDCSRLSVCACRRRHLCHVGDVHVLGARSRAGLDVLWRAGGVVVLLHGTCGGGVFFWSDKLRISGGVMGWLRVRDQHRAVACCVVDRGALCVLSGNRVET
jgi:hypothetical protein